MNGSSVMEGNYDFFAHELIILLVIDGPAIRQKSFQAEYHVVVPPVTSMSMLCRL